MYREYSATDGAAMHRFSNMQNFIFCIRVTVSPTVIFMMLIIKYFYFKSMIQIWHYLTAD